jgi:hypothetical protein
MIHLYGSTGGAQQNCTVLLVVALDTTLKEEEQMSKLSTAATLAAIVAVATPAAFAQTKATPDTRTEATALSAQGSIQPDQIRASKMLGGTVYVSVRSEPAGRVWPTPTR